jgi:hypothetical protein
MNEWIAPKTFKRKLNISRIIFFAFFLGIFNPAVAQWTFTPQIQNSGCSNAATVQQYMTQLNAQLSSIFTGMGLPSQSMCEALRQQVLAIRISAPEYDNKGNYIGECSIFYVCTSCMGSDTNISDQNNSGFNQTASGNVTIDGLIQGTSFFTSHSSVEVEDWVQEYMQKLESLGLIDKSGASINQLKIPTTGDTDFDKFYVIQSADFNPTTASTNNRNAENSVKTVPLTGNAPLIQEESQTVRLMGGSPLTQEERDMQLLKKQVGKNLGYDQYAWNTATDGYINENSPPQESFSDKLLDYSKKATESSYSKWVGNLGEEVCSNMPAVAKFLGTGDVTTLSEQEEMQSDPKTALFKASEKTIVNSAVGILVGKSVGAVEYLGEKTSMLLNSKISPEVVKMDYKDGLEIGKLIIEKSQEAKKIWGVGNKK